MPEYFLLESYTSILSVLDPDPDWIRTQGSSPLDPDPDPGA